MARDDDSDVLCLSDAESSPLMGKPQGVREEHESDEQGNDQVKLGAANWTIETSMMTTRVDEDWSLQRCIPLC